MDRIYKKHFLNVWTSQKFNACFGQDYESLDLLSRLKSVWPRVDMKVSNKNHLIKAPFSLNSATQKKSVQVIDPEAPFPALYAQSLL